jgi:hypothetical protein
MTERGASSALENAPRTAPILLPPPGPETFGGKAALKRCPVCEQSKPLTDFAIDRSRNDGHMGRCKPCDRARNRAYYAANREHVLARIKARNSARADDFSSERERPHWRGAEGSRRPVVSPRQASRVGEGS